jgi:hypothetical protein
MRAGERAAIAGLLAESQPDVAIELGTYKGGSLRTIAAYAAEVHSFDLTLQVDPGEFPNVSFHIGDSHTLLPELLSELERAERHVGFSLVDGDHSPEGVCRDVLDLISSPAVSGPVVLHDTGNAGVRRGLLEVPFEEHSKVASVDLDFVPAAAPKGPLTAAWGGLGLVLLDSTRTGPGARPASELGGWDRWALAQEAHRRLRRQAGILLRRAGLHPSQRRSR